MSEPLYRHENGIAFRRVGASDLAALQALKNESWFGTHRLAVVSQASQERWLAALDAEDVHTPRSLILVAVYADPDALDVPAPVPRVGVTGDVGIFKVLEIDWQSRRAAVGWDVFKGCRGQGLGKKVVAAGVAFCLGVLGLHHLRADVLATNAASRKCAEAAGFKQEGCQPKLIRRGGAWIDNIIYGLLATGEP